MYSKPSDRSGQRGSALVFGLMALVLAAIGIAVGVDQYRRAERRMAVDRAANEVRTIIGAMQSTYGRFGYRGFTHEDALTSGVVPVNLLLTTGAGSAAQTVARHSLGGEIMLGHIDMAAGWPAGMVRFKDVPTDACTGVMLATEKLAGQVSVGPYLAKWDDGPLYLDSVESGCTAAEKVDLVWYFHRT